MKSDTLPDFFDQSYFSEDCCCDSEDTCEYHQNQTKMAADDTNSTVPQIEINQSFPRRPLQESLLPFIEYRIKILLNCDVILHPGQTLEVHTNLTVKRKCGNLSMLILAADQKCVQFCSEGFVNPNTRGRLSVVLNNSQSSDVYLGAGTVVAFLILAPFVK